MMKDESPLSEEEKKEIGATFLSIHLNMSAVYLKLSEWQKAINASTEAIKLDPNSAKAYFRRSQAYLSVKDVDRSENDCKQALRCAPNDKAIKVHLRSIDKEKQRQNEKQKKTFQGMFGKVSLYDGESKETTPSSTNSNDTSNQEEKGKEDKDN
jgi:FK506-binding protein 4/5